MVSFPDSCQTVELTVDVVVLYFVALPGQLDDPKPEEKTPEFRSIQY